MTGNGVGRADLQTTGTADIATGGMGAEVLVDLEVAGLVELPDQAGKGFQLVIAIFSRMTPD